MILLPYGGKFEESDLVQYIKSTRRDYIIQGQQAASKANHSKPQSLDYWLRQFADNPNTKQAENSVIEVLVETGYFKVESNLSCPDSGWRCKGLRLLE